MNMRLISWSATLILPTITQHLEENSHLNLNPLFREQYYVQTAVQNLTDGSKRRLLGQLGVDYCNK